MNSSGGRGQNHNYGGQHNFGGRGNGGPPKTKLVPGLTVQGYDTDPWFQQEQHVAGLELYNGLFYKGDALVIPDLPELKNLS